MLKLATLIKNNPTLVPARLLKLRECIGNTVNFKKNYRKPFYFRTSLRKIFGSLRLLWILKAILTMLSKCDVISQMKTGFERTIGGMNSLAAFTWVASVEIGGSSGWVLGAEFS